MNASPSPAPGRPRRTIVPICVFLAAALGATGGTACAADAGRFHVGASFGAFGAFDDRAVVHETSGSIDGSYSLVVGLRIGTLTAFGGWPVSAELGHQRLSDDTATYSDAGGLSTVVTAGHSTHLAARFEIPVTERFALAARLGLAHTRVSARTLAGVPRDIGGRGLGPLLGIGAQYRFTDRWAMRAELGSLPNTSPRTDGAYVEVGLQYRF